MDMNILSMPNMGASALETDKTCETVTVTNTEFLQAIFGQEYSDMRPIVISFRGNPANVNKSAWKGGAWSPQQSLPKDANNYFSLSTYCSDDSGAYHRHKNKFYSLYVIVLDDVGTKIMPEGISCLPSWILETSEGNYQYGYILSEPLKDSKMADSLYKAIIDAGLCDPGAGGPTARVVRLPEGVNGKHNPAFVCRMREWFPNRRYSVEDLAGGLGLESKPKKGNLYSDISDYDDSVFVPCPSENPVIKALKEMKLYKSSLGDRKHDITCPWVAEHTGEVDGGTAYFEPSSEYPSGGFHCFHGHCKDRHISALLQHLNIDTSVAKMKSVIRVVAGEFHRVVDVAEKELARTEKYYQRGGFIVSVADDPHLKEVSIRSLNNSSIVTALSSVSQWEKFDGRRHEMVNIDPPERHCAAINNAVEYKHLPALDGLVRQPYLRKDGTVVDKAGYDSQTAMYGIFDPAEFHVQDMPTKEDAEKALVLLKGVLDEFSFVTESDRSAVLSAFLTAAIRGSLPVAPMFHVKAPQVGSGKSFLCRIIGAFATPRSGTPTTFPQDDEECRKLLLAEFMRSPAVIEFDNMTSDLLAHKSLCTALTSPDMTGRILGVSKTTTVSTKTLFLSSGNNVGPVQDMVRRCITINLDPLCEIPATRTFKNPDLLNNVLTARGLYVSAAITIVRAWIVAERPKANCKAIASYGEWSDLCRQPLLWLGLSDPAESIFTTLTHDPERENLGRFLYAWQGCFGNASKMVRDVANIIPAGNNMHEHDPVRELLEVMRDIASDRDAVINRRVLGWWMKRHAGQIVGGLRLVNAGGAGSAAKWKVETVSKVSEVYPVSYDNNVSRGGDESKS